MKAQLGHSCEDIISMENLLGAWHEFIRDKRKRKDVQAFSFRLMDNVASLHADLANGTYRHGPYHAFRISDPKPRDIHKASVRDRLLHHAIYRILYPFFDRTFIADSFSCRVEKGTHRALDRFRSFGWQVSKNNTRACWVLKCDIKKFFANIDHAVLKSILERYIPDRRILRLLEEVLGSFYAVRPGVGLPLGNLTSQLLVNIYMNEFDQFVKHRLKAKHYIRFADDFVVFSHDRMQLQALIAPIRDFLRDKLKLEIHEDKIFVSALSSGVDFLGWVHFPDHRIPRAATKRRMMQQMQELPARETVDSYLGLLGHGNTQKLQSLILDEDVLS